MAKPKHSRIVSQKQLDRLKEELDKLGDSPPTPPAKENIRIPLLNIHGSVSVDGSDDVYQYHPKGYLSLPENWFGHLVLPEELFFFRPLDQSMSPTIMKDDLLLGRKTSGFSGDGVYLISLDSVVRVKRIQNVRDGLYILSDNQRYETIHVRNDEMDVLRIFARVIRVTHDL